MTLVPPLDPEPPSLPASTNGSAVSTPVAVHPASDPSREGEAPVAPNAAPDSLLGATPGATPGAARPDSGLDVPRDTTPTFELEMLVSGAILFLLVQLPSALEAVLARWEVHLGLTGIIVATIGMLGLSAVYALITCFVLHLVLRGYWAALVGVHSVFPHGIRWDRARETGPIGRELMRARLRPLPHTIARLDNTASLVFATGFVLSLGILPAAGGMAVAGLLGLAARRLGVPRPELVLLGLLVPLSLVYMTAPFLDYKFGHRLRGRPERWLRNLLRTLHGGTLASLASVQYVLTTNIDKRVAYGVLFVGVGASTAIATYEGAVDGSAVPGASRYEFFADEHDTRAVQAHFYESLRGSEASDRAPSIPSEIVTGPYLRLFVPYNVMRHPEALRRTCPGLRPIADDDLDTPASDRAADAILACALKVHRPALDGRPLDAHGFRFFADPRANRRGFVMFVPTAGLAPGEHRLTVWPALRDGRPAPRTPYTIPFWR